MKTSKTACVISYWEEIKKEIEKSNIYLDEPISIIDNFLYSNLQEEIINICQK